MTNMSGIPAQPHSYTTPQSPIEVRYDETTNAISIRDHDVPLYTIRGMDETGNKMKEIFRGVQQQLQTDPKVLKEMRATVGNLEPTYEQLTPFNKYDTAKPSNIIWYNENTHHIEFSMNTANFLEGQNMELELNSAFVKEMGEVVFIKNRAASIWNQEKHGADTAFYQTCMETTDHAVGAGHQLDKAHSALLANATPQAEENFNKALEKFKRRKFLSDHAYHAATALRRNDSTENTKNAAKAVLKAISDVEYPGIGATEDTRLSLRHALDRAIITLDQVLEAEKKARLSAQSQQDAAAGLGG